MSFYSNLPAKSIRDIWFTGGITISAISRILGDSENLAVRALLNIIIGDLTSFFNVGKTMTAAQVIGTAELIVEKYHYFKPADFKLCFKRAKCGDYGQVYDRIDGPTIMGWLQNYDTERDAEIEQIRISEQKPFKKAEFPVVNPESENRNFVAEVVSRYMADKKKAPVIAQEKPIVTNPMQVMHNRWMKQFYDLMRKQSFYDWNIPAGMVRKYGKVENPFKEGGMIYRTMNVNDYLLYKQDQYLRVKKVKSHA